MTSHTVNHPGFDRLCEDLDDRYYFRSGTDALLDKDMESLEDIPELAAMEDIHFYGHWSLNGKVPN